MQWQARNVVGVVLVRCKLTPILSSARETSFVPFAAAASVGGSCRMLSWAGLLSRPLRPSRDQTG
eukprot:5553224-Pyramimonas_sp.AAC.1